MKAKTLVRHYLEHMAVSVGERPYAEPGSTAIMFGTDEIKVNYKKKQIRFPKVGWLSCDIDANCGPFDWAAIFQQHGEWYVRVGTGNPYAIEYVDVLPTTNGIIMAMPFQLGEALQAANPSYAVEKF